MSDCSRVLEEAADDNRPFTLSPEGVRTRHEFALAAAGWKKAIEESGATSVALYFTDIFDSAAALFGCWAAGARTVLPADTSEALVERLTDNVRAVAGEFPAHCPLPKLTAQPAAEPCRTALDASQPLLALFTSGSTGRPTLVVKRLSQLFCEVESINARGHGQEKKMAAETVLFSTVSQQHIYGLLFALLWPLRAARAVWHTRILYPEEMLGHLTRVKEAAWIASPAHLNRLPEHPLWEKARGILHAVYSSGGPLSEEGLRLTIERTGLSPIELLGSSESGGIAWRRRSLTSEGAVHDPGFMALPGTQIKAVDGLLTLKSPQLATDGWETTADRIVFNADGETFRLLGRTDRIVKIEGKRVSLTNIENALKETGLMADVKTFTHPAGPDGTRERIAVAAVPTAEGAQRLLTEGKTALVKSLREELLKHVERVCLPRRWRFTWALPQDAMGKVTTRTLETLFDARAPQAALLAAPSADEVVMVLTVTADCPFFEGHFPAFALLPGVVQVQWAKGVAARYWRLARPLTGIKTLKFTAPILPETALLLRLTRRENGVAFVYETREGKPLSRGTLIMEAA